MFRVVKMTNGMYAVQNTMTGRYVEKHRVPLMFFTTRAAIRCCKKTDKRLYKMLESITAKG